MAWEQSLAVASGDVKGLLKKAEECENEYLQSLPKPGSCCGNRVDVAPSLMTICISTRQDSALLGGKVASGLSADSSSMLRQCYQELS